MLETYDVYLAGPFFNDAQKARMDLAKSILIEAGLTVADPRELGPIIVDSADHVKTPEFFREIFNGNIEGMIRSFIIVASLDDKDIGTAFELGFGYGTGIPLLSFAFDGGKTNVMLGQAVDHHFNSVEEFKDFFTKFSSSIKENNSNDFFDAIAAQSNSEGLRKAEADE